MPRKPKNITLSIDQKVYRKAGTLRKKRGISISMQFEMAWKVMFEDIEE